MYMCIHHMQDLGKLLRNKDLTILAATQYCMLILGSQNTISL